MGDPQQHQHQHQHQHQQQQYDHLTAACRDEQFRQQITEQLPMVFQQSNSHLHQLLRELETNWSNSNGQHATNIATQADGLKVSSSSSSSAALASHARQQELVDDAIEDDGCGFTFQVAKNAFKNANLGVNSVDNLLLHHPSTVHVANAAETLATLELATSIVRFLRNACVNCERNQNDLRATGILNTCCELLQRVGVWIDVQDQSIQSAIVLLGQITLQFAVNFVSGNETNQQLLWGHFFPDVVQKILVECQEHRKLVAFCAALLVNCIKPPSLSPSSSPLQSHNTSNRQPNDEHSGPSERCQLLVMHRTLSMVLLQRCLQKPVASSMPTAELIRQSTTEDPAFEWLCVLFEVVLRHQQLMTLYASVGASLLSELWTSVTPEQCILLRVVHMMVASRDADAKKTLIAQCKVIEFTQQALNALLSSSDHQDTPGQASPDTTGAHEESEPKHYERHEMWRTLEYECKLVLIEILGESTSFEDFAELFGSQSSGLLVQMLDELARVWKMGRQDKDKSTNAPTPDSATSKASSEPFGYRSALLRVIGNLCYHCFQSQELVRDQGFLPLILNHCNLDMHNPMVREWSLVALRNLCENNEANQKFLNDLKPQGIDSSNTNIDLSKAGVKPVLNPETNRVELHKL